MAQERLIRVLLADDHELVRVGLTAILEAEPDLQIVGEAGDGLAAVEAYTNTRPDVTVLDLRLPVLDGLAAGV